MKHKRKFQIAGLMLLLLFLSVGILGYQWGIWTYLISIRSVSPSPNAKKSSGNLIFNGQPKGEVLLLHGLNFDADKLLDLGFIFNKAGYTVKIPRMAGHRGNVDETFQDPTHLWAEQFASFDHDAKQPLVCAGYSMGGLMVMESYLADRIHCTKFVLFAPALGLFAPGKGARILRALLPLSVQVPSGIPGDYKHFDHLGLGPTWAVVEMVKRFEKQLENLDGKTIPPGLVFSDMRDEVVDPVKTRKVIRAKFPHWKVVDVDSLPLDERHAFHLIIDERHLGAAQWARVRDEIDSFLKQ